MAEQAQAVATLIDVNSSLPTHQFENISFIMDIKNIHVHV